MVIGSSDIGMALQPRSHAYRCRVAESFLINQNVHSPEVSRPNLNDCANFPAVLSVRLPLIDDVR